MSSSSLPVKESFTDDQGTASTTRQPVVNGVSIDDESWWKASNPYRLSDEDRFSLFKAKFGRSYPSKEEEDFRFGVFRSSLILAVSDQERCLTATYGVTQFSDWTEDEIMPSNCGYVDPLGDEEEEEEEEEIELREGSKDVIQ